jgi:hypothetical protein
MTVLILFEFGNLHSVIASFNLDWSDFYTNINHSQKSGQNLTFGSEKQVSHHSMKKIAACILIFMPCWVFGQLFPKVPDFKGNIERVTEKRYGRIESSSKGDSGVFKPGKYSGWDYVYQFDENSNLVKGTNLYQGKVIADYAYQRDTIGNRRIERETILQNSENEIGDYVEYENFINQEGKIEKVNVWSFEARKNTKELFLVEMNAVYEKDKLNSFIRHNVNENGEMDTGEKCSLFYDNFGRLMRIERKDIELNLKTIIYYFYNKNGFVYRYSIDYLVGLRNDQNTQKQDIYYKYDRHGNWVKRYYWISEKKKELKSKRNIKYQ